MDILKKFRYNFHYWLKNCYQTEEGREAIENQQLAYQSNTHQPSPYANGLDKHKRH
jgi:hypothetical protein